MAARIGSDESERVQVRFSATPDEYDRFLGICYGNTGAGNCSANLMPLRTSSNIHCWHLYCFSYNAPRERALWIR
jgi:hypothetical protein